MKITKIEKKDNIIYVTKTPNIIEKIFGYKNKIEKYKYTGLIYNNTDVKVFINEKGSIVDFYDNMCDHLNDFDRKLKIWT